MRTSELKWFGVVKDGKHDLFAKDAYKRFIQRFEGKEVETVTKLREKETTNSQYAYLFGHLLPILAEYAFDGDITATAQYIKSRWYYTEKTYVDPETGEEINEKILGSFARGNISRRKFAEIIDKTELLLDSLGLIHSDIDNWDKEVPEVSYN